MAGECWTNMATCHAARVFAHFSTSFRPYSPACTTALYCMPLYALRLIAVALVVHFNTQAVVKKELLGVFGTLLPSRHAFAVHLDGKRKHFPYYDGMSSLPPAPSDPPARCTERT